MPASRDGQEKGLSILCSGLFPANHNDYGRTVEEWIPLNEFA
jgi:hypothetical protein